MEKNNRYIIKKVYTLIIVLILAAGGYPAAASEPEGAAQNKQNQADQILTNLRNKKNELKTFTANFKQIKHTGMMAGPLHSEGQICFDASGKLLMKVTSPLQVSLILKDNRLYMVDYEQKISVEKRKLGHHENVLNQFIGPGLQISDIKKQYDVDITSGNTAADYHIYLIPKQKKVAKHIEKIEITTNAKTWLPDLICFQEKKGDQTCIELNFISINEPLPEHTFSTDVSRNIP